MLKKTPALRILGIVMSFVMVFVAMAAMQGQSATVSAAETPGIVSGAVYKIIAKCSNKVLNADNSGLGNGTNINQWTDTGSNAQRFRIEYTGNSLYRIVTVSSGLVLDVNGAGDNDGANIYLWQWFDQGNQKFYIDNLGGGYYRFRPESAPGKCMDVSGASKEEGANVQQWTINDTDAQAWYLQIQSEQPEAPTVDIGKAALNSFINRYYTLSNGRGRFSGEGFWTTAEIFEIIIDAYNRYGSAHHRDMINQIYNGFVADYGTNWSWNMYNDDIMWMVLACVRAYLATGNTTYLNQAKNHFDIVYSRAWSSHLGGGLWWTTENYTKNSCINGPAAIAACYLAKLTGDSSYATKAANIYSWQRANLYEPATGKVYDSYDIYGNKNTWSSTYNQGTFIGAALMLYDYYGNSTYLNDAIKAADYTMNNMYSGGVMNNEEVGGDLPGFKGIFMRYIRKLIIDHNQTQYIPWLQKNAAVAWNNRNTQGLIMTQWATRTRETSYSAWSCSAAVSLLINCPVSTNVIKNAYSRIEAEDFEEIRGCIAEPCPDGTYNLGGVLNGHYTVYKNVNFGSSRPYTAQFRLSSISSGGIIEIRLGSTTGTLIGTLTVSNNGAWENYNTQSCSVGAVTGVHDVYLVFKGSGYIVNLNWFQFSR